MGRKPLTAALGQLRDIPQSEPRVIVAKVVPDFSRYSVVSRSDVSLTNDVFMRSGSRTFAPRFAD